jgi:hypothetical protein
MAKLNSGIIAGLALGVGAYILARTASGKKPNELKCKPNQHIERHNGIDVCVDDDKPITCDVGSHLENGICVKNFSCPPNSHAENGICVPNVVPPTSCPPFHHVENGVCVPTPPPEPPAPVKTCQDGFHLDNNNNCTPDDEPPTSCPPDHHLSYGVCVPNIVGTDVDLDPSSAKLIVTQILKLDGRIDIGEFHGEINVDESIRFRVNHTTTSGFLVKYEWAFGDGTYQSANENAYHKYSKVGVYKTSVLITSTSGVSVKVFKIITVNPPKPSQGDVTVQVFPQRQSIDIKLYNNHTTSLAGKISWNISGATSKSEIEGNITIPSKKSVTVTTGSLNEGATRISVSFKMDGESMALTMNNNFNVTVLPPTQPPLQCNTGFHEENGICVPNEVVPTTKVFKDEVKSVNDYERHPITLVTGYSLFDYVLPSKAKKIKFARIYIKAKADNFGFGGANMTVSFNDIPIGTLKWTSGNDYVLQKLDIIVTNKMKLMSNNNLKISYGHNNIAFWNGQPLASGFKITNANLYVEYEY